MTTQTTLKNTAPPTELAALKAENEALTLRLEKLDSEKAKKALKKHKQEKSLKPFQAELIRMQKYLEETKRDRKSVV